MPAEGLECALLDVRVDLGCQYDGYVLAPRGRQEPRELRAEGLPHAPLLVVPGEPVVDGRRVEYHHAHFERALGELDGLLDELLLLVERVRLEEQDVLHDLLVVVSCDLLQPLERDPLGVDVHDLLPGLGHHAGDLEADVRLARAGLAEEQGDGAAFEPSFQQVVQRL